MRNILNSVQYEFDNRDEERERQGSPNAGHTFVVGQAPTPQLDDVDRSRLPPLASLVIVTGWHVPASLIIVMRSS